jgi:predicted HTH transcriptional regulator
MWDSRIYSKRRDYAYPFVHPYGRRVNSPPKKGECTRLFSFITVFKRKSPDSITAVPPATPQIILTPLERRILSEIKKDPMSSRRQIAHKLKISHYTVKEFINKLRNRRLVKRVGPDKGGHWVVVEEGKGGE